MYSFIKSILKFATSLLIFVLILSSSSVSSHPHLFVLTRYVLVFNDSGLSGIKVLWEFDEMYSVTTFESFDSNSDGLLNPDEARELEQLGIEHLSQFSFFTHVSANKKMVPVTTVQNMKVEYIKNHLLYSFLVPCSIPINKKKVQINIAPYDPEYYTGMFFNETNPVGFQNNDNYSIQTKIHEDPDTRIYFDMIHPMTLTITANKK